MTPEILGSLQAFIKKSLHPLIVVLGPTASGKTAFSVELALSINAEIINADSRQLYKGMDIGTAKITEGEKRGVSHRLLDVLDPKEPVTIAWYKTEAEKIIADCHQRNVVPMLVGGSMLYISAVIDNLTLVEKAPPEVRAALEAEYDTDGGTALYERLRELDPETAEGFTKENRRYVIRAMEIFETSGKKPSHMKTKSPSPYDLFVIGIERQDDDLRERIKRRTTQMLQGGWIEEVRGLLDKGYQASDPGMMSHGYREICAAVATGNPDEKLLTEEIFKKTWAFARRQKTWWRGDERIHWLTPQA